MTLPRYPEYRASGVEWLGEVPAHWGFGPLGHFLSRSDSGAWGSEDDPEGTVVLRSTNQTADGKWCLAEPARRILSARERSLTRLDLGDLLMTKSSGSFLHIGKTTYVDLQIAALNAGYSNFMQRLRCGVKLDPKFSYWFLNSALSREQFSVLATTSTGLGNLNRSVISSVQVTAPPLPEQHAIVAYLDRETARIDELTAKVEQAIELLGEYRTALITAAVTGQVDVRRPVEAW